MKKFLSFKTAFVISLVVIAVLSSALIVSNKKLQNSRNLIAERNVSDWGELFLMSTKAENISNIGIEEFAIYHNHVVYNSTFDIYPRYSESDNSDFGSFLRITYDQFLQDIKAGNISKEDSAEAVELYLEINDDLEKLCKKVLNYYEEDKEKRIEVLDSDSEISKKIIKDLTEFTEKNSKKIEDFRLNHK